MVTSLYNCSICNMVKFTKYLEAELCAAGDPETNNLIQADLLSLNYHKGHIFLQLQYAFKEFNIIRPRIQKKKIKN